MGKLTEIGHISRGLDFLRQRSSIWLGLGRTQPWPNEASAPAVDVNATTVEQLYGLIKLENASMVKSDSDGSIIVKGKSYTALTEAESLVSFGPKKITNEVIATPSVATDNVTVTALKETPIVPNLVTITATDESDGTMTMTDQKADDFYGYLTESSVTNSFTNYIDYKNNETLTRESGVFTDSQLERNKLKFSSKVKANTDVLATYTYTEKSNYLYLKFELGVDDFPGIDYRQYGVFVDASPAEGYASATVLEKSKFNSLGKLVYLDNFTVRGRYTNTRHLIEIIIEE